MRTIKCFLAFEFLDVFYPQPEFDCNHFSIILLCQFNSDPSVLLEERMVQQDLYRISTEIKGKKHIQKRGFTS